MKIVSDNRGVKVVKEHSYQDSFAEQVTTTLQARVLA